MGGASSSSRVEPQRDIAYSGASRSTGVVMWRIVDRFLDAMNRGSESWYLSAKMTRGRVRWACREHVCSTEGGLASLIRSWRPGWRPVGFRNVAE